MIPKIEKKSLVGDGREKTDMTPIYEALRDIKVGESFLLDKKSTSHIRMVLSALNTLLNKRFSTRRDGDQYRVGRVK